MRILVFGGTGDIGRNLCRKFYRNGHILRVISRDYTYARDKLGNISNYFEWDGRNITQIKKQLEDIDVVVNLMGENIGKGFWSGSKKSRIVSSRVETGKNIVEAIGLLETKPKIFIQASATGFYKKNVEAFLNEEADKGVGFMADLVDDWENTFRPLETQGLKVFYLRIGTVLSHKDGIFPTLKNPYRFGFGGVNGDPENYISWIHIKDFIHSVVHIMENDAPAGVYNLTSPSPCTNKELDEALSYHMSSPSWFSKPKVLLKAILGQKAEELLFTNRKVLPTNLIRSGYTFRFESISKAVSDLISKKKAL